MKFCPTCAQPVVVEVPADDNRERHVCKACDTIHYQNPRVVVGAVATWDDRILLCKRAIEPRTGFWTLPAGFLELGETSAQGAAREAHEEACAHLQIGPLLCLYDLPHIHQVQLFYRATLVTPEVAAGPESLEVGLFTWAAIPWDDLAFPTVRWALDYHRQVGDATTFTPDTRTRDPGDRPDPMPT